MILVVVFMSILMSILFLVSMYFNFKEIDIVSTKKESLEFETNSFSDSKLDEILDLLKTLSENNDTVFDNQLNETDYTSGYEELENKAIPRNRYNLNVVDIDLHRKKVANNG